MKRLSLSIALITVIVGSVLFAAPASPAYADDSLVVKVGYAGGPFYEKRVYAPGELTAMSDGPYEYATVDHGYKLRHAKGYGVPYTQLASASGIDQTNLWRLAWDTDDNHLIDQDGYGVNTWSWSSLTSTRYFYPNAWLYYRFIDSSEKDSGIKKDEMEMARADKRPVPAILATRSSLKENYAYDDRIGRSANETEWEKMPAWDTDWMRMMIGQRDGEQGIVEMNARFFVRNTYNLYFIFGGKPTITFDESEISGEIGEEFTIMPTLYADDPLIAEHGLKDIVWDNKNPNAVQMTQNSDGSITVKIIGNGTAEIGAVFGESKNEQFLARGGFGVKAGTGIGEVPGDGEGDWAGLGGGTGNQGTGTGSGETGTGTGAKTNDSEAALDTANPDNTTNATSSELRAEEGAEGSRGGGSSGTLKLDVQAIEEEQVPYQMISFDEDPAWMYFAALAGCLCFGGLRRIGAFELARDHYQPRKKTEEVTES